MQRALKVMLQVSLRSVYCSEFLFNAPGWDCVLMCPVIQDLGRTPGRGLKLVVNYPPREPHHNVNPWRLDHFMSVNKKTTRSSPGVNTRQSDQYNLKEFSPAIIYKNLLLVATCFFRALDLEVCASRGCMYIRYKI